jgi:hypothetical protein
MSFIGDLIGDVFGGITGAKQAGKAAEKAGQTQAASAQAGIEEQRRQFDALVNLMSPFVNAGTGALAGQQNLIGLGGADAQNQAISGIADSPLFMQLQQQGENALLQNSSATGGLRGGNVQAALAQFRPQMLQQAIDQQFSRLGGIASQGQAAAAGQAQSGLNVGDNVSNLLANQGRAVAGGQIARGGVVGSTFGTLLALGAAAGSLGASGGAGAAGGSGISLTGGSRSPGLGLKAF